MTTEVEIVGQDAGTSPAAAPPEEKSLLGRFWDNLRTGNLGVLPLVVGLVFIVIFFSYKATNFFTAPNFINIVVQMAGTTMLAYGVVFVLLLGEIDLSISYVAGIGALTVAILQNPGSPARFLGVQLSSHELNGLIAMVIAVAACAVIGLLQGTVVAKVGVPSFVVTLAGFLIWQGVILHRLEVPGSVIIQDRWINYTANYTFSHFAGWLIAALITGLYALAILGGVIGKRRAGIAIKDPLLIALKIIGVAIASFGTVAICNHVVIQGTPLGLPLPGVIMVVFLVALTYLAKRTMFGRHVYAVGGNAEAARRAGINVSRIRILVFVISSSMAAIGGIILAANVNSVDLNFGGGTLLLNSIAAAVIGGTSLFGGRGEVWNAFLGAAVIATVSNGLNTAGYSSGTIYIVTGVILLLAVTLDTVGRRLQVKSGR
jgi:D-xylose transport system permease protein